MSFLFPWGLALAGLALVPLLLHLVRRDTDRRIAFPSLRYLQSAQRQSARSMRIRDWLLVASRISVVALIAFAASRPLAGSGDAGSHDPTDLLLIVDNTASMQRLAGGASLLDAAIEAAGVSLSYASPEDRVWLVTPVDGVVLEAGTADDAIRLLATIRPSDGGGSLPVSIARTASTIPSREGRAREIQLLTDFQSASFEGEAPLTDDWSVRAIRIQPDQEWNGAVSELLIGPSLPVPPGAALTVTATLSEFESSNPVGSAADRADPAVRLLVDGRTVGISSGSWGSDVVFSVPAPGPGSHSVRVEIDPAGLRSDDGRQAGVRVAYPSRVFLPADAGPDAEFIRKALETLADDQRIVISPAAVADILIESGERGAAERGISAGVDPAHLLLPPSDMTSLSAFNEELERLGIPWRLEPDPAAGALRIDAEAAGSFDGEHVAFRYRLLSGPAPADAADSVLLRTSDGEPWLVRGRVPGAGIYLLLASPLKPGATSLPVRAGMIEFTEALVNRWSRPAEASGTVIAGEEVFLPAGADSIAGPGSPSGRAEGGAPWRPRTAGIWRVAVRSPDGPDSHFVGVNPPIRESGPAMLDREELARLLVTDNEQVVDTSAGWEEVIFASRTGRPVFWLLIVAALTALAMEAWLAAPRTTRSGERNQAGRRA